MYRSWRFFRNPQADPSINGKNFSKTTPDRKFLVHAIHIRILSFTYRMESKPIDPQGFIAFYFLTISQLLSIEGSHAFAEFTRAAQMSLSRRSSCVLLHSKLETPSQLKQNSPDPIAAKTLFRSCSLN
uniref:Uncharacterized protein n=1 Tax=Parascaris univalens TaxID=6257 RepID=A0A915ANH0_PARUN